MSKVVSATKQWRKVTSGRPKIALDLLSARGGVSMASLHAAMQPAPTNHLTGTVHTGEGIVYHLINRCGYLVQTLPSGNRYVDEDA